MESKKCIKCGEVKSIDLFYRQSHCSTYRNSCKSCDYIVNDARRRNNLEKHRKSCKKYYDNNQDKIKAYRESRKDITKIKNKIYRDENREKIKQKQREMYHKDPQKVVLHVKEWRKKNPKKYREQSRRLSARHRAELHDHYVKLCLKIPRGLIPDELIELKREQLKLHRRCQ